MSVMTQLHDASASHAINSSADANPRAAYPSEPTHSTRAIRNGSSSSMTAIRRSLNAHRPLPDMGQGQKVCNSGMGERHQELYAGVTPHLQPRSDADHVRHPDQ